ncbi:MAG: AAA family ATPase, partial [Opitutae bacterium]
MDLNERIKRYLDNVPPAVSGDSGHKQAFTAACALVNGFGLTASEAEPFFREYSARCDPPWNDREIRHKLESAESTTHTKPKGHLLGGGGGKVEIQPQARETKQVRVKLATAPSDITGKPLPEAVADGTRVLLQTAFDPADFVRLVVGEFDDDGKDRPAGAGIALKASDWLQRLEDKGGDPNRIFSTTANLQPGIFIGMNPVEPGGKTDKSVTSFRHALIEFDDIPLESQWELITSSNIPCAAVISSGGKSVHAWVRINAKDRQEFDERVSILHETFAEYGVDRQNRNPARLSRLAGCARGSKRQELLATNIGAESFTAWLSEREVETGGIEYTADDLMAWRPENDDKVLLGERFLSQKGSWLVIGQSGIGKSSLAMQAAMMFALGKDLFGLKPARPLRQLIVQAENDFGDLAEQFQGVANGLGIDELSDEMDMLNSQIKIVADATHIGKQFVDFLQRKIDKHAPDIVWIDPLLSFIGDDISRQDVCGRFLREWLNPVAEASHVAWAMMHHTNKPPQDSDKIDWEEFGAYAGTGSAELTNWARATSLLRRHKSGQFLLSFGKRQKRTGIRDQDGKPVPSIWLKQSDTGICWHQAEPPPPPAKLAKGPK